MSISPGLDRFLIEDMINQPPAVKIPEFNIRIAELADLPVVVTIYNQAVTTHRSSANTVPWTIESRKSWFRKDYPARRVL